ncbi:unnamed protein product [Caenorhabditis auriculariae]|uniref:Clustered mitochondria protein homolog n=1 Tax=Caenorhabditis auriculariae TaxID=2777116 RepID=A0A8S1GYA7_9PELO|nr:unnamed protein product [Caenorhabditis auriculariae]
MTSGAAADVKGDDISSFPNGEHKNKDSEELDSGNHSTANSPDVPKLDQDQGGELANGAVPLGDKTLKLNIQPSVGEPFELQVNDNEMVQELYQTLLDRDSTCHRTCFSLHFNGQHLDSFIELKNVPDLVDGSTIIVIDEPFSVREARIHLKHVRELLRSGMGIDPMDVASAVDCSSFTFLQNINMQDKKDGKDGKSFDCVPPDFVLPGTKERSLAYLLPSPPPKNLLALRNISVSAYNPPPGPRKLKGDILYINVELCEKRLVHVTCCTKGFYVNASTDDVFNPLPSGQYRTVYHSLVELLNAVSPTFKKVYPLILKRKSERSLLERLPSTYPVFSWVSPALQGSELYSEDSTRSDELSQPFRVGYEDHLPGSIRDWNEELQTTFEMSRGSIMERIIRDRSYFKIHSDFINAAVRGATAVIDGNVIAINPADDRKTHMFIWQNIFFSLGFDVKDHYKELGGDAAAFAATAADLQGVKAFSTLENSKLCTLGMAIFDYRGYRVTAQSIIPGILEREQEQSVVYGSIDFGKSVVSDERYHGLLEAAARELRMMPHEVISGAEGNEKTLKLFTSYETKGIIGNDGRTYVLDLLRTMPPDVHFLENAEVGEAAKKAGYPRKLPHKLPAVRRELVDLFHENRCLQFIKVAAQHVRNAKDEKTEDEAVLAEAENDLGRVLVDITEGREPNTENSVIVAALAKAAVSAGSLRDDSLDIRFNPDCFSTLVRHAPGQSLERQRNLVIEICDFILTSQIPELVQQCLECVITPIDGEGLSEQLHMRGINIRYLGEFAKQVDPSSSFIRTLVFSELVCRSAKHIIRPFLNSVTAEQYSSCVSHLLSAVFGSGVGENVPMPNLTEKTNKKNNKKASGKKRAASGGWTTVTSASIWKSIVDECKSYFGYDLKASSLDALIESHGIQKISLLRRVCRSLGIQLAAKDYQLDSPNKTKSIFGEDDINNLYPVIKHQNPWTMDAKKLYGRGQQAMQLGQAREAFDCIAESVNLMTSVYGAMHAELAQALRCLARLSHVLHDSTDALNHQHKATMMSERVNGLDSGNTIMEYVNLAHFAFANLLINASLRLLYRARYLLLINYGEKHPIMAQIDSNIGVILFAIQEYESALKFLNSADSISKAVGEPKKLKTALITHMIARVHASRGDFRAALVAEKETYSTYVTLFGADNERTKESSDYLGILTQQAVTFQKKMMDANKSSSISQLLPIQIQAPSLSSILEVLNILNGFIIIPISPSFAMRPEPGSDSEEAEAEKSKALNQQLENEGLD